MLVDVEATAVPVGLVTPVEVAVAVTDVEEAAAGVGC